MSNISVIFIIKRLIMVDDKAKYKTVGFVTDEQRAISIVESSPDVGCSWSVPPGTKLYKYERVERFLQPF